MKNEDVGTLTSEELAELLKKAKRLKEQETGKKITQKMIADAIGVERVTVTMWEQGKRQPSFVHVVGYCQVIGITPNELIGLRKKRTLHIELSEEERQILLSMVQACQDETELDGLQKKLRELGHSLKDFLSRAYPIDS